MAIKIQPLTKKQLAEVVECYATVFPDWEIILLLEHETP